MHLRTTISIAPEAGRRGDVLNRPLSSRTSPSDASVESFEVFFGFGAVVLVLGRPRPRLAGGSAAAVVVSVSVGLDFGGRPRPRLMGFALPFVVVVVVFRRFGC